MKTFLLGFLLLLPLQASAYFLMGPYPKDTADQQFQAICTPPYVTVITQETENHKYAKCFAPGEEPCTSPQVYDSVTYKCSDPAPEPEPDPCEDVPNYSQCTCEMDGKYYDSLTGSCSVIPQCKPDEILDFNTCFDPNGCGSGESIDASGECSPDPEPDPTPDPDPDPTPDPEPEPNSTPDPDTDGDGTPDSQDPDDDGDGIPDTEDPDIDGDGIPNADDSSTTLKIDLSGVESRLNTANTRLSSIDTRIQQSNNHLNQIKLNTSLQLESSRKLETGVGKMNTLLGKLLEEGSGGSGGGTGTGEDPATVSNVDACGNEPQCTGDIINCAVLIQSYRDRCNSDFDAQKVVDALGAQDNSARAELETLINGTDIDLSTAISVNESETASCPAPYQISIMSTSVSVPFTMFCDLADIIRPLVIAAAWLVSGLMFIRSL